MLDIAINHEEELKKKFRKIWLDEKYQFYNYSTYYSDWNINNNTWDAHQFVYIDKNGDIIGYIGYTVKRQVNKCDGLGIINFSDDKIVFGMDVGCAIIDISEKFKFRKLNFSVVIGNPIEKTYDKLIKKYGGRIVGIYKSEVKLIDGNYYDVKNYEILRENYLENKR